MGVTIYAQFSTGGNNFQSPANTLTSTPADDAVNHRIDAIGKSQPMKELTNVDICVSDSRDWSAYGNYQVDSYLRNFVIRNETPSLNIANAYIANPGSFMVL